MFDVILLTITVVMLIVVICAALAFGYFLHDMRTSFSALRSRMANLEQTDLPVPAIIDPKTPKEIKEHLFDEPDEESAIVVAKKPDELRRERDRKLNEELDRLGR